MDIPSLNKTDVVNMNSVKLNWDEPPGDFWLGYNYTLDGGTSFTFTTLQNQTLTGLDWCTQWTFEIYSLGDCGLTNDDMLSENSQSLTHYLGKNNLGKKYQNLKWVEIVWIMFTRYDFGRLELQWLSYETIYLQCGFQSSSQKLMMTLVQFLAVIISLVIW